MKRVILALLAAVAMALGGASSALATDLHQSPPIDPYTYSHEGCGDVTLPDGMILWHFVLTQTDASSALLTTTFANPPTVSVWQSSAHTGSVLHWNVYTGPDAVLMGATTTADGALLNLSHTCTPEVTPSSMPSVGPSAEPSESPSPSTTPSATPTSTPSTEPSDAPSPSQPVSSPTAPPVPSSPTLTPPPTDTPSSTTSSDHLSGWIVGLIAGLTAFVTSYLITTTRPPRRRR